MNIGVPAKPARARPASPRRQKRSRSSSPASTPFSFSGCGGGREHPDADFQAAGASIAASAGDLYARAELILQSAAASRPRARHAQARAGARRECSTASTSRAVAAIARTGATAFALEAAPRISRAQSLDVLSSAGEPRRYKAVMVAANLFGKIFPMLMTAAGTIKAARVVVMGVGVAGLQAIATAKRLGAVVEATDVRPETKEQVESLGAKFIEVPLNDAEKELAKGQGATRARWARTTASARRRWSPSASSRPTSWSPPPSSPDGARRCWSPRTW